MHGRHAVRLPDPPRADLPGRLARHGRRSGFRCRPSERPSSSRTSGSSSGSSSTLPSRSPTPVSSPPARELRTIAVFALEFPPINAILRWKDLFPTFNKIALIAVAAALIGIVIFLLAGNRDGTKAPTRRAQPRRDHRRVHRGPDRHADDGPRRACAGRRSCSACSSSSTCATCPASSRSSRCRRRPASPSRCASACSCG